MADDFCENVTVYKQNVVLLFMKLNTEIIYKHPKFVPFKRLNIATDTVSFISLVEWLDYLHETANHANTPMNFLQITSISKLILVPQSGKSKYEIAPALVPFFLPLSISTLVI